MSLPRTSPPLLPFPPLPVSLSLSITLVKHATAQVVSRQPVIAETRVPSQASPCKVCGGQGGTETGLSPSTSVFPFRYHSTNTAYSTSYAAHQKNERAKAGNLPKSNTLSEVGEHWIEKYFHLPLRKKRAQGSSM